MAPGYTNNEINWDKKSRNPYVNSAVVVGQHIIELTQGGRGHWTVYYTSPKSEF